ncbi:transporter [Burkholderia sp. AU18528]|nr:ESPR-type extended signal peptide-containing protein [Burkholderia sp. AU18528]PHP86246.1 transporter [Burkholderia sp. AU18528]
MNKTYRNIWNTATGTWTAVAETARSRSKGSARAARQAVAALALGSASIGGAFAADACTTEDGKGGSLDAAGVCKATASRTIGTDAIGTFAGQYSYEAGTGANASGDYAVAVGVNAKATAGQATAIGENANAAALLGTALGQNTNATEARATALGAYAQATAARATAVGATAVASGEQTNAIGFGASASADRAIALGSYSRATNVDAVAIGTGSITDRDNTVSVGSTTLRRQVVNVAAGTQANDAVNVAQLSPAVTALGGGATINPTTGAVTGPTYTLANGGRQTTVGGALGALDGALTTANGNIARNTGDITTINSKLATVVTDDYVKVDTTSGATPAQAGASALAVGANAQGTGTRATAVGNNSVASDANSSAFGTGATASGGASTAIGAYASATGYHASALGVAAIASGSESVAIGTSSRADRDNSVSVGSSTLQRQITNMAAGTQGTDAVNVAQLQPVVDALGGGATINPTTGAVTGPTYTLANGGTQTTVGGALGALDGALTTANDNIARNTGDIADLASQIGSGTVGLVQQAGAGANITVGANTDGAAVDFTGTAGARKLTGVDGGAVTATSKDAVNGSQLHGVSDSVASAIGGGSTVNADGSISAPSFTVGDGSGGTTTVHSVGDVVTNLDGRVTTTEGAVASLADQLGNGTVGLVQQAGPGANLTVGANTDGAAVSFAGTAGARKLSGVANGVNDDDAVTIAQLRATGLIDYTGKEIAAVTYDDISLGSVTFGGSSGTKLLNVAPGLIAAGSMEAVNGGQLHDLQERFAQEYARLDGRVGDLETGGGSGGGGGGGNDNVGRGTGGDGSLVVGDGSVASGENSTAVGQGAVASGNNGSAVGQGSAASGSNSSAIGQGSVASGSDSTAIGQGSKATGNGSVAIGAGSVADRDNSVSVGSAGHERQITNVADGTAPTDAVNVRQLDQRFGETNRMINDVAKNAYAGVAAAMAMPNLTPSQPGKTVVAAGAANYKSGSAIAAGATYRTRDGKWLMNGAVSVTSTGDAGVRAQVGYEF